MNEPPDSDRRFSVTSHSNIFNIIVFGFLAGITVSCFLWLLDSFIGGSGYFTRFNQPIGGDYINIWTASVLMHSDNILDIFSAHSFHEWQVIFLGADFPLHFWAYPPHTLLYISPFGALPYIPSYLAWVALTFCLYLYACRGLERLTILIALLVLAPASILNVLAGQNGFLIAALFIGGMRLTSCRPVMAGILIGLMSYKPQLAILIPIALLAERNWVTIISAGSTAAILVATSVLIYGIEPWFIYLNESTVIYQEFMNKGVGLFTYMIPTVFMAARHIGFDSNVGYVLQAITAVVMIVAVYKVYRMPVDPDVKLAFILAATFLTSPFAHNYDMTLVSVSLLIVIQRFGVGGFSMGELTIYSLVWSLPMTVLAFNYFHLPLGPVIIAAYILIIYVRVNQRAETVTITTLSK